MTLNPFAWWFKPDPTEEQLVHQELNVLTDALADARVRVYDLERKLAYAIHKQAFFRQEAGITTLRREGSLG